MTQVTPSDSGIQIVYNVVGGVVVAAGIELYHWSRRFFSKRAFRNIFGSDSVTAFSLVFGNLVLMPSYDEHGRLRTRPYAKPSVPGAEFSTSIPVPFNETKSAKYLAETFGAENAASPRLISDDDVASKLDLSFCSFGGLNNSKTSDLLMAATNTFYALDLVNRPEATAVKDSGQRFSVDGTYDYGFIIKLHPPQFPGRTWIAVAGLGEWGTSGAAWYLAKDWRYLEKYVGSESFGVVVKVRGGQDESAQIVHSSFNRE